MAKEKLTEQQYEEFDYITDFYLPIKEVEDKYNSPHLKRLSALLNKLAPFLSTSVNPKTPATAPNGFINASIGRIKGPIMESITLAPGDTLDCSGLCVVGVVSGKAVLDEIQLHTGNFALVPACVDNAVAQADTKTVLILARPA